MLAAEPGSGPELASSRSEQRAWFIAHELPRELRNCLQVLDALANSTEEEFLGIGSELRDLQARSVTLCEKAGVSVRHLSGELVSGVIVGMDIFEEESGLCADQPGIPADACLSRAAELQGLLSDRYRSASHMAAYISERIEEIKGHIFAMVTFLQFHDITRQQFERSHVALRDALDIVLKQGEAGENRRISVLADVLHFCDSQIGILQRTREEFLHAAGQVVVSLRCIAGVVRDVMAGVSEAITGGNADDHSFLKGLARELAVVKGRFSSLPDAGLDQELETMITVLDRVDRDIADAFAEIGHAVPELLRDLERVATTMTIHTIVDGITDEIATRLGSVAAVLRRDLPDSGHAAGMGRIGFSGVSRSGDDIEFF
ncbi:MAG: hypothetical protein FIA94_12985 [Nitrospirae bacterium]|nr:hypothetical protein [Nitrospirota bacterium]